jgi:ABC-2 type transport system ATP-binding protein
MIEVKNLSKRYGQNVALNNISFSIEEGTVVGFLGPNGAGKSTTMNIITGYLSASSGVVTVGGHNTLDDPNGVKKLIGYMPELPPLYPDMTVKEYLNFMYDLKKVTLPREKHIKEICALVKINEVYGRLIANLSKGYKQRVGIAQALLGNPPVLILDEPTVGLDPKQIIEIRNMIKNLGKNHTVILSSHILPEIQAVCERIIVINKGNIVGDGTPDSLSRSLSTDHKLIIRMEGPEKEISNGLKAVKHILSVQSTGEKEPGVFEYQVEAAEGFDVRREIFHFAAKQNWAILSMSSTDLSLEDVFLRLTNSTYMKDNTMIEHAGKGDNE